MVVVKWVDSAESRTMFQEKQRPYARSWGPAIVSPSKNINEFFSLCFYSDAQIFFNDLVWVTAWIRRLQGRICTQWAGMSATRMAKICGLI